MISSSGINLFVITILFYNVLVDIYKKELLGNEVCLSHLINRFYFQEDFSFVCPLEYYETIL